MLNRVNRRVNAINPAALIITELYHRQHRLKDCLALEDRCRFTINHVATGCQMTLLIDCCY